MGLDISASLFVGVGYDEVYQEGISSREIKKKDKNGVKYIEEEFYPTFTFLGTSYFKDSDYNLYDLLDQHELEERNKEVVGIEILGTESHRSGGGAKDITPEDLNKRIDAAMNKLEKLGLNPKIYLIHNISY